ncbi:MAG: nitroreductase family protein [Alphaproteobacteria bacterium]
MGEHESIPLSDFRHYPPADMLARAQDFYAEIRRRHSVRAFSGRPVDRAVIDACLMAAGTAPSGANHQPWHFAVIGSPEAKARVRKMAEAEEEAFYAGKASADWLDALRPLGTDASKPYLETAPWLIAIFAQRRGGVRVGEDRKNYYPAFPG